MVKGWYKSFTLCKILQARLNMFQLFSRTSQQRSVFRCLLRCILSMSTKASNPLDESPVEHKLEKGGRAVLCQCANSKVRIGSSSGNCTSTHYLKSAWWYKWYDIKLYQQTWSKKSKRKCLKEGLMIKIPNRRRTRFPPSSVTRSQDRWFLSTYSHFWCIGGLHMYFDMSLPFDII